MYRVSLANGVFGHNNVNLGAEPSRKANKDEVTCGGPALACGFLERVSDQLPRNFRGSDEFPVAMIASNLSRWDFSY